MSLPTHFGSQPTPTPAQMQVQGWAAPAMAPPSPLVTISAEQKMELLEYWRSVLKRKWAILALGAAVAAVAGVIASAQVSIYQTGATVLIEPGKGKIVAVEEVYARSNDREHYQTQIEIIKSRDIAERTARAMKLWDNPTYDPRLVQPDWKEKTLVALGIRAEKAKRVWTDDELLAAATDQIRGGLSVTPIRQSQLVVISFKSTDPKLAAEVVNVHTKQYIEAERGERYDITQSVGKQLQGNLAELRANLANSERALQAFRERQGIVALGGSTQAVAGQNMTTTMSSLSAAQARRIALEAEYQQAKAFGTNYSAIPAVARNAAVQEASRAVLTAENKVASLLQTLSKEHERVVQAEGELAQLKRALFNSQKAVIDVLQRDYELARSTEQALASAAGTARTDVQNLNRQEFELSVLEREYQNNRQLYDMFISRVKETNITGTIQPNAARVIDSATPNYSPIAPNRRQTVLRALMVALALGALASILLDRLDNTVKGGEDAENRLKQPVLAALPLVTKQNRSQMARVFLNDVHSHFAEGIRTARTGVMLSNLDVERKTLLITSTLPGEGKTTVSINLALAHAQSKRTLLIDADMRRSQVGRALGLPRAAKGLTNLVAGTATVEECAQAVEGSRLMVMGVGDLPPNPLELLLSNRFKEVLAELSEHYEMIIIDSPPVELVSEALVLAPLVTSVTLVVKAMSTPAPLVRKSLTRLQRAGGRMLGVIVNQLDFAHSQKYYGEYGSATYSYGTYGYAPRLGDSGFGADAQPKKAHAVGNDAKARKRA